jgi:hypothetical protein
MALAANRANDSLKWLINFIHPSLGFTNNFFRDHRWQSKAACIPFRVHTKQPRLHETKKDDTADASLNPLPIHHADCRRNRYLYFPSASLADMTLQSMSRCTKTTGVFGAQFSESLAGFQCFFAKISIFSWGANRSSQPVTVTHTLRRRGPSNSQK